jgi:hypothetical protein
MPDSGGLALLTAETGDTTQFTDITVESSNTLTATVVSRRFGGYGFDFYVKGTALGEGCYGNKALSTATGALYVRWYMDIPSGTTWADEGNYFVVRAIDATPNIIAETAFNYEATGTGFVPTCRAKNDSATYNTALADASTATLLFDTWYCFEMYIKVSSGAGNNDGVLQIWQDGVLLGSLGGLDNDTYTTTRMRIGSVGDIPLTSSHIYVDALKVDTSPIGFYKAMERITPIERRRRV